MGKHICITCEKEQKQIFVYKQHLYFQCHYCGLVSTYPYPDKKQILSHYKKKFIQGNYRLHRQFAIPYNTVYKSFADLLISIIKKQKKNIKGMRVLDIGCFTGDFLEILKKKGANVYGLELQKEAVEIANKRLGENVYQADVMTNKFPLKKFDVLTMLGVVEHVTNPAKLIERCSRLLKKDGIIFIQTPNSGSFLAKLLHKYWPPYEPIEHIHLFSKKSLVLLLEKNGFSDIKYQQSWKKLPVGYTYNMLQTFGGEFHTLSKPFSLLFNNVLSSLVLPFYVGEMTVIAKKI